MRILVTGSRYNLQPKVLYSILSSVVGENKDITIITGGATGVDTQVNRYALEKGYKTEVYMADWRGKGKAAGPLRNKRMLEEGKPTFTLAFHFDFAESKGTTDMINQSLKGGVPVYTYVVPRE